MTTYEITSVTLDTKNNSVLIEAADMDAIFSVDEPQLDAEFEAPVARFLFDGKVKNGAQYKYLYKVCAGQRKCRGKKSLAATFMALEGCFVALNDSFRVPA